MSLLSPRLQLKVAQKQILTPGLVQMVTVLQLNRLELKEMITQEIVKNPVLEEATEEAGEEVTPEELLPLLEAEAETVTDPADKQILEAAVLNDANSLDGSVGDVAINGNLFPDAEETAGAVAEPEPGIPAAEPETPAATDPFDEIDFGTFFDDYLDPGYKSPASESVDKPSFETFLSAPLTLGDYLRSQLSVSLISDEVRDAAESIIGNLDEDGYLFASLEEIASVGEHRQQDVEEALKVVQALDPAGVGARSLQECMLLQIESVNGRGGVAWQIVSDHMRLLEMRQSKEIARLLGRPMEHVEIAVNMIHHLNPRPGLRYSGSGARVVEPDVSFIKDGDDYLIQMNDEDVPQLRLNPQYRRMLDRENGATKEVRDYVRERYTSAIQLMKNIEQRKQTILKVCQAIVRRQTEFLVLRPGPPQAHDDQRGGGGGGGASLHRQPRRRRQVRPYAARGVRAALFLLGSRAGPVGRFHPAAPVEADGEEDDCGRRPRQASHGRADHRHVAGPGDQRHTAHGGEIPRGYEDPVHPPAARPELRRKP